MKVQQPDIYQMLLLHVGGTDKLKHYVDPERYWQSVQVILDGLFTAAERAEMCAELIDQSMFLDDPAFTPFLDRAKAEIRCRDLVAAMEETFDIRAFQRSGY